MASETCEKCGSTNIEWSPYGSLDGTMKMYYCGDCDATILVFSFYVSKTLPFIMLTPREYERLKERYSADNI